jgi:proteic killer suppression protein
MCCAAPNTSTWLFRWAGGNLSANDREVVTFGDLLPYGFSLPLPSRVPQGLFELRIQFRLHFVIKQHAVHAPAAAFDLVAGLVIKPVENLLFDSLILCLTSVRLQATLYRVKTRSFVHKGLKKPYAEESAKGVPPDTVDKVRKTLAFLDDMQDPEELRALAAWKVHTLTGDRKGTWSLSVTRNRRSTFRIDTVERAIYDVNLEDYH